MKQAANPLNLTDVQKRTLKELRTRDAGPAHLSSLVWPDHIALRRGAAPGTGLVRPMLAVLARLREAGLVEWYSPNGAPVVWTLTSRGMDTDLHVDRRENRTSETTIPEFLMPLTRTQKANAAAAALRGDDPFLQGFGLALAEMYRLNGDDSSTCETARNAGVTIAELEAAGVDEYDLEALRKAGVP